MVMMTWSRLAKRFLAEMSTTCESSYQQMPVNASQTLRISLSVSPI